jgi:hypothetical protein
MTGSAQLQHVNPAQTVGMTIQAFSHSNDALQIVRQLAQGAVTEHTGTITTKEQPWIARFASTDDSLQAAIAIQRATDLFNFNNGSHPPILLGIHITSAENSIAPFAPPPAAFLRPGEIHLSESAYRAIDHDHIHDGQPLKFRTVDHASTTAYKAIWKMQEFELASATHHQGAPSVGFFIKVILICLIPFLLVLAYTWREPLQHSLSSLDGTRTIDHQLE